MRWDGKERLKCCRWSPLVRVYSVCTPAGTGSCCTDRFMTSPGTREGSEQQGRRSGSISGGLCCSPSRHWSSLLSWRTCINGRRGRVTVTDLGLKPPPFRGRTSCRWPAAARRLGWYAVEVFEGELVEVLECGAAGGGGVDVDGAVADVVPGFAGGEGGLGELADAGGGEGLPDAGVGAEPADFGAQDEPVPHVRGGAGPDAVVVFGAGRLEVEVDRAGVVAGVDQVDDPECAAGVPGAEPQVLVEAGAVLPVQVEVEQLAVPQCLRQPVGVVQPGHLLVPGLGVQADLAGMGELADECQGVPDGGQQDVAARLVRLGLDGEPQVVPVVQDILGEYVEGFLVPVQRGPDVLGGPRFGAFPAAPGDVGAGAEVGGQVQVVHDLAQRVPADVAVVGGERAVLEHRMGEQVGRRAGHHQPGAVQRGPERGDPRRLLRGPGLDGVEVVVVEVDAVGAELGQLVHGPLGRHRCPGGGPEHIGALPADGPDAEREPVSRYRPVAGHGLLPTVCAISRIPAYRPASPGSGGSAGYSRTARAGQAGGPAVPASAQAACRAAPTAA